MNQDPIDRDDMEALLATRQELGPNMEPALVDSFAQKIIFEVQRQSHMQQQLQHQADGRRQAGSGGQLALGIVSLALAIPLTAIALSSSPWMAVVVWMGIVLVNFAHAMKRGDQS